MLLSGHRPCDSCPSTQAVKWKIDKKADSLGGEIMPYANLVRILYRKRILSEADPVSRRPDFLPIDNMYKPNESLLWDEKVPDIDTN